MLYKIIQEERGQDLIEYGLLASFISITAILTLKLFSVPINAMYQLVITALT